MEMSRKTVEKVAAIRSGNYSAARQPSKVRRAPFALTSVGSPVVALFWKNLISAGQVFTPRLWIVLATSAIAVCFFLVQSARDSSLVAAIGMAAGMLVVWSLFYWTPIVAAGSASGFATRRCVENVPVRGWEIALGELLAPAAILTGVQWLLLLVGGVLLWSAPNSHLGRSGTLGIGAGAARDFHC